MFSAAPVFAADPPPNKFLALGDAERAWFLEGAFRTVSHLISLQGDRAKADCVGSWYLKDKKAKRELIVKTLQADPSEGETTVVLALLTQACGPLTLK